MNEMRIALKETPLRTMRISPLQLDDDDEPISVHYTVMSCRCCCKIYLDMDLFCWKSGKEFERTSRTSKSPLRHIR